MDQFGVAMQESTLFQAGRDIVFQSGPYSVTTWSPPPRPEDLAALVDRPSALLNPAHQVVEFTGRDAERAGLAGWRDSAPVLSVLWLHGPGGQGKTRLADRFADDSLADGWRVLTAAPDGARRVPEPPGDQRVLLVVDYADRWRLSHLGSVVAEVAATTDGAVRVLLLARSSTLWAAVCGDLDSRKGLNAHTTAVELPPLAETAIERRRVFDHARDCFAPLFDVAEPATVDPPGPLDDGQVLSLHMAALVAVDARARRITLPDRVGDLSHYLLNREQALWVKAKDQADFSTPSSAMRRAVYVACLTGALPYDEAKAAIAPVVRDPHTVLDDHCLYYPADDPELCLQPLTPDRLAEDHLAFLLPGGESRPAPWALPTLRHLVARDGEDAPRHLAHALTYLAAASDRGPHVAAHLEDLLREDPRLAIDAGSAVMVNLVHLDVEVLALVVEALPTTRNSGVEVGAHAITEVWVASLAAGNTDPLVLARAQCDLGDRAVAAGLPEHAIRAYEASVALFRSAATEPPDRLGLALALVSLANQRSIAGDHAEAAPPATEADALLGELVALDPGRYEPLAALPRLSLAGIAVLSGDADRAVALFDEVVAAESRDDLTFAAALGGGLLGLANALVAKDAHAAALPHLERAVTLFRALSSRHPDALDTELAMAVGALGNCYQELGRAAEADVLIAEALDLARAMARANPTGTGDFLEVTLAVRAIDLADAGRFTEATALADECLEFSRSRVSEAAPHRVQLAQALFAMAHVRSRAKPSDGVWPLLDEAADLVLGLRGWQLRTAGRSLVNDLFALAAWFSRAQRPTKALAADQRALEVSRHLVAHDDMNKPVLFIALHKCASLLLYLTRTAEALVLAEECAAISAVLDDSDSDPTLAEASALFLVAMCHLQDGHFAEAIASLERALALVGPLSRDDDKPLVLVRQLWTTYLWAEQTDVLLDRVDEWLDWFRPTAGSGPARREGYLFLLTSQATGLLTAVRARLDAGEDHATTLALSVRCVAAAEELDAAQPDQTTVLESARALHAEVLAAAPDPDA